jgi:hypothetical protein
MPRGCCRNSVNKVERGFNEAKGIGPKGSFVEYVVFNGVSVLMLVMYS